MALRLSLGFRNMQAGINTELATYGDFTADAGTQTNWTESVSTILGGVTFDSRVGCLSIVNAGYVANAVAITTKIGHFYKLKFDYNDGSTAGTGRVLVGSAANSSADLDSGVLPTGTAWVSKTLGFIASSKTTYVTLVNSSTGLKYFDNVSVVCMSRSYQDAFRYSHVKFYTGTQPATPQLAPTGTLVCTMKNGAAGMTFDESVAGALVKPSGETWSGACEAAGGTVGWARLCHIDDLGTENDLEARVDFRVSTSGAEANFDSVAWGGGSTQSIASLPITRPMSA